MKKINWLTTIALCVVLLNFAAGCSNVGLSGSVQADSSAGHSENAYGGGTGNPAGADNSAAAENVPAEFNIPSIEIAVGERHAFSVRGWTANNPNARAFYVSDNAVIGQKSGDDDLIIFYNGSTYTIPVTVTEKKQAEAEVEVEEETRKDPVWMKQALEPNASVWADGVNVPAGLGDIWVEDEGSGFFNVLKTAYALTLDEHTEKRSDANFCYGAAAANLVHWWEKANQGSTSYKLNGDYTTGYMESSVYNMFLRKYNNGTAETKHSRCTTILPIKQERSRQTACGMCTLSARTTHLMPFASGWRGYTKATGPRQSHIMMHGFRLSEESIL